MINKALSYLNLTQFGFKELLFAFYPIISGYSYGVLPMDLLILLALDIYVMLFDTHVLRNDAIIKTFKSLLYLMFFIIIHELFLFLFIGIENYHLNNFVGSIIFLLSIFIIVPSLNYRKFVNSLFLVAIISSIGIVYHFVLIENGAQIHPIKLPLLPDPSQNSRLFELGKRPCSFFWEPSAFADFMMVPLFLALCQRKIAYAIVIAFSILLSTSSNGFFLVITIFVVYSFMQKISLKYRMFFLIFAIFSVISYVSLDIFKYGSNKIASINVERNARLSNGPKLILSMPMEYLLLGVPSANTQDYSLNNNLPMTLGRFGDVYISTFWNVLAKYGIIGLLLYLNVYYKIFRIDKTLLPYMSVLLIYMFTQGSLFANIYVFQIVFISMYVNRDKYMAT
jgi:hypothetical protein